MNEIRKKINNNITSSCNKNDNKLDKVLHHDFYEHSDMFLKISKVSNELLDEMNDILKKLKEINEKLKIINFSLIDEKLKTINSQ